VRGHAEAKSRLRHRTANPYSARVPLPTLQGNVPLAVVCNETQFHASVGNFWEEAPEGHVHVSGNDTAAASATFRQIVVEAFTWFSVDFGVSVVQVEDSDKRVHAIEDGLVPLHLDKEDATRISSLFLVPRAVAREACDSMRQSEDCAASVQWRRNP